MEYVGGWLYDQEDSEWLYENSLPPQTHKLRAMRTWQTPEEMDFRGKLQVENQGGMGSCQGHALTSATELAYFFETGDWIQLNRMFAYVNSQRKDGIRGDRGSTISGGVRCAKEDGICLEATWPYTGRYTTEIPQKCFEEAEDYRIKTAVQMRSYDDVFEFLASGIGGINIGIMWGLPSAAVIESYRSGGGGHAVCLGGYTKRKDSQGRNYILLFNSWGTGWGNQGVAEVAPKAIEDMLRARFTEAYGLSDMVNIEPRRIKYRFL